MCVAAICLLVLLTGPAAAQGPPPADLAPALRAALQPALPFPTAQSDGTPPGGEADVVWTVRWPPAGTLDVTVMANPLNPGNRQRALKAEEEIQKAAMASQRRSQADYEKAVGDFQRTGKVSGIREISLRDDGVAGERYDAESQLSIRAQVFEARHSFSVGTSRLPESLPGSNGAAFVVRLPANTYLEAETADEPAALRFCPEQAWVFFGNLAAPTVSSEGPIGAAVSVTPAAGGSSPGLVIAISGNAGLVDRVLREADWAALRARFGG